LFIGALVIVVATVALMVIPRKQSIESLRKEYLAACSDAGWTEAVHKLWNDLRIRPRSWHVDWVRRRKRIEGPEKALTKLGYLEERTFAISNSSPVLVMDKAVGAWSTKFPAANQAMWEPYTNTIILLGGGDQDVIVRARFTTNAVIIVAPGNDMAKWAELVSEAESGVPNR